MRKDTSKFRERFQRWKETGESPYEGGRLKEVIITPDVVTTPLSNLAIYNQQEDVYNALTTLPNVVITGDNKHRKRTFKYTTAPFQDWVEFDKPYHEVSGLGSLGFVQNKKGDWRHLSNSKQCAFVANRLSSAIGAPTAGNAWTTHGIYGDSVLINGYDSIPKLQLPKGRDVFGFKSRAIRNRDVDAQRVIQDHINELDVQTGDIVGLSYKNSPKRFIATRQTDRNTPNTHTGRMIVLPTQNGYRQAYVVHNVNGKVHIEPFQSMTKAGNSVGVVNIIRPNKAPNFKSYRTFGYGPNDQYFFLRNELRKHMYDNEE